MSLWTDLKVGLASVYLQKSFCPSSESWAARVVREQFFKEAPRVLKETLKEHPEWDKPEVRFTLVPVLAREGLLIKVVAEAGFSFKGCFEGIGNALHGLGDCKIYCDHKGLAR
jgi:hypothetical protein